MHTSIEPNEGKVGIMTLTQSENYGTVLQAYATKKIFDDEVSGHQVSLIPTDVKSVRARRLVSLANPRNPNTSRTRLGNFISMRRFISPLTEHSGYVDITDRKAAIEQLGGRYRAIITGSDEIWNLAFVGPGSVYYAPPEVSSVRMSFATSANRLDIASLGDSDIDALRDTLLGYRIISVRDTNTRDLVKQLVGDDVPVRLTIDPTLQYAFPEVDRLASRPRTLAVRKSLLVMVKDRAVGNALIAKLSKSFDVKCVFIRYPKTEYLSLSPLEFVREFGRHDFVVTDFFHGTCMTVRAGTPFLSFDSESGYASYESKIGDLTRRLGLTKHYLRVVGDAPEVRAQKVCDRLLSLVDASELPAECAELLSAERLKAKELVREIADMAMSGSGSG